MTAAAPVPAAPLAAPPPRPAGSGPGDWTEQVSIIQPRQTAFWLFSLLLLVSGVGFVEDQLAFANVSTTAWLVGLVLLALYAVPVYLLINALDLFEREPRSMLIGALLWGAIVATFLSGRINGEWSGIVQKLFGAEFAREWGAALVAPGVEELVKFLGIVLLYLIARKEFDSLLDGFVYVAMVGLGFTLVEDMYYFFTHFVGEAGASDLGGLFEGFFIRIIVGGPYSHVLMTGLTGLGLAYYVTRPDVARSRRLLVAVGLYTAGVLAHFIWNSPILDELLGSDPDAMTWITWAAIKGLPFLILLAILVRVAQRREHAWVRETLADDVAAGLLTTDEVDMLGDLRRRRAARAVVKARKGPAGERLATRLQHAQIALAVAESSTATDREARLEANRAHVRELRAQLDALPEAGRSPGEVALLATSGGTFAPTHRVPPEGIPAWATPDPAGASTPLAGGLELELVQRISDWVQVRASNGWTGWVDARRLIARVPPPA